MKFIFKIAIDIILIFLMIFVMAYQSTGQLIHEYLGLAVALFLLIHNILNLGWYKNIFKGKYTILRGFQLVTNLPLIIFTLMAVISGIAMSSYALEFLNFGIDIALARRLHLFSVYWTFIFMAIHLGGHSRMIASLLRRKNVNILVVKIILVWFGIFGAFIFYNNNIYSYMFLLSEFAFFDFGKNIFLVLIENIALMTFWALIAYYILKFINKK